MLGYVDHENLGDDSLVDKGKCVCIEKVDVGVYLVSLHKQDTISLEVARFSDQSWFVTFIDASGKMEPFSRIHRFTSYRLARNWAVAQMLRLVVEHD